MMDYFKTTKQVQTWLEKNHIYKHTIYPDLSVDVKGSVDLSNKNLHTLPVKFNGSTEYRVGNIKINPSLLKFFH